MTRRQALIIGCHETKGEKPLAGAKADIDLYSRYLKSNVGGAWEDGEVAVLANPTRDQIRRKLGEFRGIDYFFFSFSGHGGHDPQKNTSYICCGDGLELAVNELFLLNCDKQQLVLDSCRTVIPMQRVLEESVASALLAKSDFGREDARKLFDEYLGTCEAGREAMYACSVGQSAGDNPDGGVFSKAVIQAAEESNEKIAPMDRVFEATKSKLAQLREVGQTPTMTINRRRRYFPFAVRVR